MPTHIGAVANKQSEFAGLRRTHAVQMETTEWFRGQMPSDPREARFVRTVAETAASGEWSDVSPSDTSTTTAYDNGTGCLVEIQVPHLTTPIRILRVLYDPDDHPALQSEWSHAGYAFEDPPHPEHLYEGELYVSGLEASPEQYGQWAAQWFERQLRREVLRQEWDRRTSGSASTTPARPGRPVAVRWIVKDPDHSLNSRGAFRWWRLMRQPPDREIVERD